MLRPRARRIRCHGAVRRQRPRRHPHHAARDLHRLQRRGRQRRHGDRPVAHAHPRRGGRTARHAGLARGCHAVSTPPAPNRLAVDVSASRGGFTIEVALGVDAGETLAVLGPNGSGKSTLLAIIAGHLAPTAGTVRLGGRTLAARRDDGRVDELPVERRRVALLGQEALLFPHLTALENIAFGPRATGMRAADARRDALGMLERFGLAEFAGRRPRELSGGQQQRVAIARALASRPDALLLDEPFASLDVQTAAEMRRVIAEQPSARPIPTLLVTHDPIDAIMLADRAAILQAGRIVQEGPTAEVLGHPATPFAAALAGVNLASGIGTADGSVEVIGPSGARLVLRGAAGAVEPGARASAVFSPGAVHAARADDGPPAASAPPVPNRWAGTVTSLQSAPGGVRIVTAEHPGLAVDVPSAAAVSLGLVADARLAFAIAGSDVSVRAID
ncbi:molybdenum ABC transporter ATP-binding protein [Agromyces badenianii]|uniref:Molybdenum ABC transporter ATP-binding protein n=1 Tax=Agromyces badenianii TaxID=2080742 RepID=A0A2S0WXN3_9MICO|nr:molybdenum ABC transporter ATP-binding protein [Agromyces badenianii]